MLNSVQALLPRPLPSRGGRRPETSRQTGRFGTVMTQPSCDDDEVEDALWLPLKIP